MVTGEDAEPTGDVIAKMGGEREARETISHLPIGHSLQFVNGQPQIRVFEAEPIWDASSDGRIIMAVNESIRIEVRDSDGALVRIITRPHEVKEATERDQRVFRTFMRDAFQQQGAPAAAIDAAIERFQFAVQHLGHLRP